jgi:thiamine biosynthesis lipoprotein
MRIRTARAALAAAGIALCAMILPACRGKAAAPVSRTEFLLGTSCTLTLYESGQDKAAQAAFSRIKEIEDRMSANKDGTELAAVNAQAGIAPQKVSPDTFFVIGKALEIARLTGGALDPSIGPLVKLWGIGTDKARVPSPEEIAAARALVDYSKVKLDKDSQTAYLPVKGMRLDLGAVAKGYAADEAVRILKEGGVARALIDLGGNIYAMGRKKDGSAWRIGIQDPDKDRGSYMGIMSLAEGSLVTSGGYERYFEDKGERYHHILDAKTGYPARSGLKSVTIVSGSSILADCMSTAVFVLGPEKGFALADGMAGLGAVLLDDDGEVRVTANLAKDFAIQPGAYSLR